MSRTKLWLLVFLLFVYLAGILLLSTITLQEPKNRNINNYKTGNQVNNQILQSKTFEYGIPGLRSPLRRSRIQWCADLKYLIPPQDAVVALASFPGSGNTWLRYLLQQATGIYTGSVYKDYGLLKNGFPAENVINGSVLVVKTHEWGAVARKQFTKAILLVRAPGAAIQAEFNRQSGGHVGFASPERYKRAKGRYWQQFVHDKLQAWKQTNLDWLHNFTGPTHIIFYEQLVKNVENTLRTVLDFLEYPISDSLFQCAMARQEGIYRRKKKALTFNPFNGAMKKELNIEQEKVYNNIYNMASPVLNRK